MILFELQKKYRKNPKFARIKHGRTMLLSKCAVCDVKNHKLSNSK